MSLNHTTDMLEQRSPNYGSLAGTGPPRHVEITAALQLLKKKSYQTFCEELTSLLSYMQPANDFSTLFLLMISQILLLKTPMFHQCDISV